MQETTQKKKLFHELGKLPNSLSHLRVLYTISYSISQFHIIYRHVAKFCVKAIPHPPPIIFLVFRYVPDLNTQKSLSFHDPKTQAYLFFSLNQIIF